VYEVISPRNQRLFAAAELAQCGLGARTTLDSRRLVARLLSLSSKHEAARRHRIPRARYRLTNWLAHEAGLRRRDASASFYANGHDLRDPMLSPVYGDLGGFPPTILTTGTRDLLLSNTVRVHRKLRQAGIEAALHVYEGQSHAYFGRDDRIPETREAFEEIAALFRQHLAQ
jgi:acetyl esterase/lipase